MVHKENGLVGGAESKVTTCKAANAMLPVLSEDSRVPVSTILTGGRRHSSSFIHFYP